MKYLILLRAINISGKNIVKMKELKEELLALKKYKSVVTLIQTGNIVIDSEDNQDKNEIESNVSLVLEKSFNVQNPKMSIYDLDSFKSVLSKCSIVFNGRDNIIDKSFDKLLILFPCSNEYLSKDYEEKEKSKMKDSNFWVVNENVVFYIGPIGGSLLYRSLDKQLKSLNYTGRNYRTCQKCLTLLLNS